MFRVGRRDWGPDALPAHLPFQSCFFVSMACLGHLVHLVSKTSAAAWAGDTCVISLVAGLAQVHIESSVAVEGLSLLREALHSYHPEAAGASSVSSACM